LAYNKAEKAISYSDIGVSLFAQARCFALRLSMTRKTASLSFWLSDYQHCIAVGIEAVSLFDGVFVSGEDVFQACEGRYECEQGGFRQMMFSRPAKAATSASRVVLGR
jgi:hypothetical protein